MKLHENQQTPKEYGRFEGQDHGTRGTGDRWDFSEQMDIDKPLAQQEFITKQEIADGIEDYSNSEFKIPEMRETSDFDELESELSADELVYTTDVNRLPDDLFEEDRQSIEIDDQDDGRYEVQVFSNYTRGKVKARKATMDHEFDQEDHGDDFPSGMHITNRP